MIILGADTTGNTLSVGISRDEMPIGEIFLNQTKKHSETFMLTIDKLLDMCSLCIDDIDVYGVSIGPGSFTGIRIGAAAIAGLAHATGREVACVDTLFALCRNLEYNGNVCAIMNAGRGDVYAAAYRGDTPVVEACAMNVEELVKMLPADVIFVGDGIDEYRQSILSINNNARFAPPRLRYQRGLSVCAIAYTMAKGGSLTSYKEINPRYLRLSQAERLKRKES